MSTSVQDERVEALNWLRRMYPLETAMLEQRFKETEILLKVQRLLINILRTDDAKCARHYALDAIEKLQSLGIRPKD